jgi:hypothetical protein
MQENLETEFDEFAFAERETEPDEFPLGEDDTSETDCCWIMMGPTSQLRCSRPLHAAPEGVDEKPVCLMHSQDPNKRSGALFEAFWKEFDKILEEAGEGEASFECLVFPCVDFFSKNFNAVCSFDNAVFTEAASFSSATFRRGIKCENVTFMHFADFRGVTFKQTADFTEDACQG